MQCEHVQNFWLTSPLTMGGISLYDSYIVSAPKTLHNDATMTKQVEVITEDEQMFQKQRCTKQPQLMHEIRLRRVTYIP